MSPLPHFGMTDRIELIIAIILAVIFYLLPSIIARQRDVAHRGWLIFINVILGPTIVGWFIALAWAILGHTRKQERFWERYSAPRSNANDLAPDNQRVEPRF